MTGSSEGVMRVYRNYDPSLGEGPTQLVTAYRALPSMTAVQKGSGMVMDWQQNGGTLIVGGDSKTVKVWDIEMEMATLVSTRWASVSSPSTSLNGRRSTGDLDSNTCAGYLHCFAQCVASYVCGWVWRRFRQGLR